MYRYINSFAVVIIGRFYFIFQIGRHSRVMLNTRPLDGVGIPVFWFSKNYLKRRSHIFSMSNGLSFERTSVSICFCFLPFYFFVYFWSKVWSILVKMCTLCSLPELFRTKLNSAPHFGYSCKYFPPVYYIYIYSSI